MLSPKQSGVLKCHLSQYQKMKIMSYVFRRVSSLRPEKKKVPVICLAKKKDTVVCLLGARFWRLRPEKKRRLYLVAIVIFVLVQLELNLIQIH